MKRRCLIALAFMLLTTAAFAQQAIPTPDEYLGYKLGEQFTPWDRIVGYFDTLAARSKLITLQTFGRTYEGRPLMLAVITSQKNRAALDSIRADHARLIDPAGTDEAKANDIAAHTPGVVWLAFGVHGNETSSSEAAMEVAGTLLRDPQSSALLDDLVIVIDPLQNPDGRERYIQWFKRTRGADADPNPDAYEHQEPWPGGRYNHYLIDMNRDWTWMSQRETQARVAMYRQWNPQVFVDFHEMGYQSTYFFPPDAKPINGNLPPEVEKWLEVFGRANAEAFSKKSWPFFVAERFDLFYPGYGDAWPSLHGAIGMTYEVAGHSRAGVAVERDDGTVLTLSDRVVRHYTTAMTTLRTAAANREPLLRYTYNALRMQVESGKNTYLILPGSPNFPKLVSTLEAQGIRVQTLTTAQTLRATRIGAKDAGNHTFPAGTAVVSTKQPYGGLVETLLERSAVFTKGFLEEQRQKTQADEPDDFYDLTTWSLPLAMNVEAYVASGSLSAPLEPYAAPAVVPFRSASYGYLVDALEPDFYRFLGALLKAEVKFSVSEDAIELGARTYARGSVVILRGNNSAELDKQLTTASENVKVTVVPLDSGWMGGTAFGSEKLHFVKQPKIALIGGSPAGSTSYGMLWHTLDIDTPIPHSNLSIDSLRNIDLDHYRVLVFPDGDYGDRIGKKTVEKLQRWVQDGGTLVAIKGASDFLRDKDVAISKLKAWEPPKKKDEEKDKPVLDERYNEPRVPGSAFRTAMNERSYLTFGVPRPPAVLIEGTSAYLPVSHKVDNVITIVADDPLVSGVAWPESLQRIKGAAYVVSEPFGKGSVITFADEPHFRLFWRGTLPIFLNAVIYSPSFPR